MPRPDPLRQDLRYAAFAVINGFTLTSHDRETPPDGIYRENLSFSRGNFRVFNTARGWRVANVTADGQHTTRPVDADFFGQTDGLLRALREAMDRATFAQANATNAPQLDEMLRGYITAALWTSLDDENSPTDSKYSLDDIDAASVERARRDCDSFVRRAGVVLGQALSRPGYTWERVGHDFWLTRNGHGAGFWDRQELQEGGIGARLTEGCRHRDAYLIVGDDGKLHFEGSPF